MKPVKCVLMNKFWRVFTYECRQKNMYIYICVCVCVCVCVWCIKWFSIETLKWNYVLRMEKKTTSTLLQEYSKETHQPHTSLSSVLTTCLEHQLIKSKKTVSSKQKKRSRGYLTITITDADCADDIALPVNASAQAKILFYSLKRTAATIGLRVNAHKTKYMCFNQIGDISALNGSSLKLVPKFTCQGSSV